MHFLGVAGTPKRVPDYPDAFQIFNKIASYGSYVSAFSLSIFFLVFVDASATGRNLWFERNHKFHPLNKKICEKA
jgi:cytochrome c oxidase subunit 1